MERSTSGPEAGAPVKARDAHAGIQRRLTALPGELRATEAAGREAGAHRDARAVVETFEAQARVESQVAVPPGVTRAALAVVAVDTIPAHAACARQKKQRTSSTVTVTDE